MNYDTPSKGNGSSNIDVAAVKKHALEIEQQYGLLAEMFKRYREIYFMTNVETPKNQGVDRRDWKITASPSGRNEVTGMKRLMDTAEINITIKSGGKQTDSSDRIEEGLKAILRVSGEYRRARIEKDANLSAVLFGPVVLTAESVGDLLAVHSKPIYKNRLNGIRKRTPFLIKGINPEESFPEWGEFGQVTNVRKYEMMGAALKERWGVADCKDNKKYIVHECVNLEYRVVWVDGITNPVFAQPHGLPSLPIVTRYAGGSSLFIKPEEMMQSFLYAKAKGEWDKRENLFWTYLFTAIFMQGLPGPLLIVDPDSVTPNATFDIDFSGGIRKIVAKAQQANFPVIDGDVLQLKNLMDDVSGSSTIYKQTLGENISGATFSGLSMLSSAGKLPMVDPQEAVEMAFSDIFLHILQRIKGEGIENELIAPADIPDDVEVEVTLAAKLPQDNLRNASVAQNLGDLVSDEWKHENLLQISNSKEMMRQSIKEQIFKAMVGAMVQNPEIMNGLIQSALGKPATPPQQPPQGPSQGIPPMPAPSGEVPPEMMQGQPPTPGMEAQPQIEAMIPPQERT